VGIIRLLGSSTPRARSYIPAAAAFAVALALAFATPRRAAYAAPTATPIAATQPNQRGPFFLPHGDATKIVTVTKIGNAEAGVTILTEAVAVKETGPKATVAKFGEVYAFSPTFIAVHRDQPTEITFWNLQPDDEHDFALVGPDLKVLMYVKLDPRAKTTYIFTFHKEGVIDFKCLRHQPEMSGQFLVLPPMHE
jgi:plastocyanin